MTEEQVRMPDTSRLLISSSPHFHAPASIHNIMFTVVLALVPAMIAAIFYFGIRSLWIMLVTVGASVAWETLACKALKKPLSINDGTAVLTGLLLALTLPPTVPEWVCVVGALISIVLGKMVYGGMGYNPFNPAMVGRVALLLAVPSIMTDFIAPQRILSWSSAAATETTATPLAYKEAFDTMDLLLGNVPGAIGETCFLAVLAGGIFLACLNLIRWQIPACFIGTVALITGIAHVANPAVYTMTPLAHVLSGGLGLGAFFMATDMVTTPLNRKGAVVFGIGCGVITSVIRLWGSYPEGITYGILIMNALTPLIDKATSGRPFGAVRYLPKEVRK